jgi:hypothetical protein
MRPKFYFALSRKKEGEARVEHVGVSRCGVSGGTKLDEAWEDENVDGALASWGRETIYAKAMMIAPPQPGVVDHGPGLCQL